MIIDNGPRQRCLVLRQGELVLKRREGSVRLMNNQLGVHLGDQEELALSQLGCFEDMEICLIRIRISSF